MDAYSLKLKDAIKSVTMKSALWFLGVVLILGSIIGVVVYYYPFGWFVDPSTGSLAAGGQKGVVWKCALLGFGISIPTAFALHISHYI